MPTDPATAFVWSFLPNWRESFKVDREYRTDTIVSRSRREQRRALRTTPRRAFDYETTLGGAELREFNGLMAYAQNKPFIMPDWSRRSTLSVTAAAAATTLTFAVRPAWVAAGHAVFLYDRASRPTAVQVLSVAGNVATLTLPLAAGWPAGTTVLPGPVGFIAAETAKKRLTSSVAVIPTRFAVEPTSEPAETPPAAAVSFNGREVCLLKPNWGDGLDTSLSWAPEITDFQRGAIAYTLPFLFPVETVRAGFLAASAAEGRTIEQLFDRMKGRRGEFYMPSGENDLPPITGLTGGAATLRVAGTNTASHYAASPVYAAVCVALGDGSQIYRKVAGIAIDGGNSVITLTATWGASVALGNIVRVSWMPVWRFASDLLTMEWITDSVARAELIMQMLEDLPAEAL